MSVVYANISVAFFYIGIPEPHKKKEHSKHYYSSVQFRTVYAAICIMILCGRGIEMGPYGHKTCVHCAIAIIALESIQIFLTIE